MKTLLAIGMSVGLALGFVATTVDTADAQRIRNPECRSLYKMWRGLAGYKSFAISRNGRVCGYSYGFNTPRRANRRALRECRVRSGGRRCFVYDAF